MSSIIAYVHLRFPIGFAKKEFENFAKKFKKSIHILTIDDFSNPEWIVDLNTLNVIASEISWHASVEAVDPNGFSIDDFRFATQ